MKNLIRKLAWLSVSITSFVNAAPNIIPYGAPNIDGTLSPHEWAAESRVRMARFYGTDQFTDFYLQWDDKNLYIAGITEDFTLNEDGGGAGERHETHHDDSVEFYLHPVSSPIDMDLLSEYSRIVAFTPTGRFQRLDRGTTPNFDKNKDKTPRARGETTSLETFKNTTNIIGEALFLNTPIPYVYEPNCLYVQPQPAEQLSYSNVVTQFKSGSNATSWWFEMALPWELVGTRIGSKITGDMCAVGQGIFPTPLAVQDGTPLKMNFKRIHDDNGGAQNVVSNGIFTNNEGGISTNGTLSDEWMVYQGDAKIPAQWATFVLRKPLAETSLAPNFSNLAIVPVLTESHRARVNFFAPSHGLIPTQPATGYRIRYQEGEINPNVGWENMTVFKNTYQPASPNISQTIDIIGLNPNTTYTVALKAYDEVGKESKEILSTTFKTTAAISPFTIPFVTTNPTGRTFVTTDGKPFVLLGETVLMPWLPVRGLYNDDLCDEGAPIGDKTFDTLTKNRTCSLGRLRNYATEKLFYTCHLANGNKVDISDSSVTNILTNAGSDPTDNCNGVAKDAGTTVSSIEPIEGEIVAINYFAKLKAAGINVVSVFVESLDLNATPIHFQDPTTGQLNESALLFVDKLIDLAQKNDVRVMLRLYDTYYYRKKWSETYWAKALNKPNYDQFFDADIYDYHKLRLSALFDRVNSVTNVVYRDDPTIFGYDLLNEIDNKERFNTASLQARQNWLKEMLSYTHEKAPRQLAFFSFLTWDPKDDSYYRKTVAESGENNFLGMDAETAFRIDNASFNAVHGYYANIANPQSVPPTPEFQRPLELARGIAYNFYQVRDGRPIQDTESAPSPLFIEQYDQRFTKEMDKEMFLNSAWLHFVNGGAGANMRWPITIRDPQTITQSQTITQLESDWRDFLKYMKSIIGEINWRGDQMNVSHLKITDYLYLFARHDDQTAVAYLFNPTKLPLDSIQLNALLPVSAKVDVFDPRTGKIIISQPVTNASDFKLNAVLNDHAVIILKGDFAHPVSVLIPQIDGTFLLKIGAVDVAGGERFEATIKVNLSTMNFTLGSLIPTAAPYAKPATFSLGDMKLHIPTVAMFGSLGLYGDVVLQYNGSGGFNFLSYNPAK